MGTQLELEKDVGRPIGKGQEGYRRLAGVTE